MSNEQGNGILNTYSISLMVVGLFLLFKILLK